MRKQAILREEHRMAWHVGIAWAAGLAAASALIGFGAAPASACNRTDGCARDVINENYSMMVDGRNDAAMRAGQANVEAYRAFVRRQQQWQGGGPVPR